MLVLVLMTGTVPASAAEGTDGILTIQPISERSCLSVRVDVSSGETVTGMKWFNGSGQEVFARILAAAGTETTPPPYADAVVMMDSIGGMPNGWSEVTFPQAVTSATGWLYITFQYPAFYTPPQTGSPLGIGFITEQGATQYFVSCDGDDWVGIAGRCKPQLEPVIGVTKSKVLVLGDPAEPHGENEEDLPKVFATGAFPNPFNPKVTIRLSLPKGADCRVQIYDIRGRLVNTLQDGYLEAGIRDLVWWGRDQRDQSAASGVYLVKSQLGEKTFTNRLVLLK